MSERFGWIAGRKVSSVGSELIQKGAIKPTLGTERDRSPHFAGRKAELALLRRRLDRVAATRDARGGISLVTGVPGAGKTELATKFCETIHGMSGAVPLMHDSSVLSDSTSLFMLVGAAVGTEDAFKEIAQVDSKLSGAGVGTGPLKVNATIEHVRRTDELAILLDRSQAEGLWRDKALALVLDELQTMSPAGAENLRVLHQGLHGCPILVVGVGLQHLQAVLAQHGITRIATPIDIGPLSLEDASEAIGGGLEALGHHAPESAVERFATASYGFPQHIHCYLEAAVGAIEQHGGLDRAGVLDSAVADGDRRRRIYYDTRLQAMGDGRRLMQPVIKQMRAGDVTRLDMHDAAAAIDAAGLDGESAVQAAIAHGVLTVDLEDAVSFGIPSFHTHMVEISKRREIAERRGTFVR